MNSDKLELIGVLEKGYGNIPKMVMQDRELHPYSKAIYAYFCSYAGSGTTAFPGREKICYDLNISKNTFHNYLKQLKEKGYIDVKKNKSEDGKFSNNVYVLNLEAPCPISPYTVSTDADITVHGEKDTNNNIYNNNNNNKYIVEYDEIISYLNEKADTHYKSNNKQTRKHINARLNEGFTVDDFKTVIDKKCNEWLGTEYEKYLRPDTLFTGKFESYLNQNSNIKSENEEVKDKIEQLKLKNYQLNETLDVMQHSLDIESVDDIKEHKFQMEWLKDAIEKNNNLIEKLER